jgi:hypothetical protein
MDWHNAEEAFGNYIMALEITRNILTKCSDVGAFSPIRLYLLQFILSYGVRHLPRIGRRMVWVGEYERQLYNLVEGQQCRADSDVS